MELREFLKRRVLSFLMIQAGITLSVGIIGCIKPPPHGLNHYAFFMPFVYAFFCILPSFVMYSSKELSVRQMALRKVIQFFLTESVTLLISYLIGTLDNAFLCVAITAAVAVIYAAVNVLDYLFLKSDADMMTTAIKKTQVVRDYDEEDK